MNSSALVFFTLSVFAGLPALAFHISAGLNAVSVATELTGPALFAFAFVVDTLGSEADLVVGATVGVAVVFFAFARTTLLTCFACGVASIAIAGAVSTTCVGSCTGDVVARIIDALPCKYFTDAAFAAFDCRTFVGYADAFVANFPAGT